jgi:DNA repair protein RAD50
LHHVRLSEESTTYSDGTTAADKMSRIDKLSIVGVRAFDPMGRETLAFETPLTLIVGFNGSGKTTIIECLRYATTGELPPGTRGAGAPFIHDPKVSTAPDSS